MDRQSFSILSFSSAFKRKGALSAILIDECEMVRLREESQPKMSFDLQYSNLHLRKYYHHMCIIMKKLTQPLCAEISQLVNLSLGFSYNLESVTTHY